MTQAATALLAAAIGGMAAVLGALVLGFTAIRNETRRRAADRTDSERQALRARAAQVFKHAFVLQHEMEWLTWHADQRPEAIGSELTAAYESAVHAAYSKILGAMAVLASLDPNLYEHLLPLTEQLYSFESDIGTQITRLRRPGDREEAIASLRGMRPEVKALYLALPPRLAEALQAADARYEAR